MKTLDIIVVALLVFGGLNWGLIGFFNFNLVGTIFGEMSALARLIYSIIGVCALYQIFQWKAIQTRWKKK